MKLEVVVTPRAREQIRYLKAWWRRNRPKAPARLRDELRRVFDLISAMPEIGLKVEEQGIEGLRSHPLKKTPYLVYYIPRIEAGRIEILAVWSAVRGEGPDLG